MSWKVKHSHLHPPLSPSLIYWAPTAAGLAERFFFFHAQTCLGPAIFFFKHNNHQAMAPPILFQPSPTLKKNKQLNAWIVVSLHLTGLWEPALHIFIFFHLDMLCLYYLLYRSALFPDFIIVVFDCLFACGLSFI